MQLLSKLLLVISLVLISAPANAQDTNQQTVVDTQTLENLKLLHSNLEVLHKDSVIVVSAIGGRTSFHALSPNFFGSTVIVPIPPPSGYITGGPAAPNVGLFKAAVIDMHNRLCEATETVKMVVIPKGIGDDTLQEWTQTLALINKSIKHYNEIEQLCFRPKADRLQIGRESIAMCDETNRAKHLSKSVYATLKNASENEQNVLLVGKKRNIY